MLLHLPLDSASPKYALVEQSLLAAMAAGSYAPGDRIPGERALADRLHVAPLTVRRAVNRLVEQGALERRGRSGTYVRGARAALNVALLVFNVPYIEPGTLPAIELETLRAAAEAQGRQVRVSLLLKPYPPPMKLVDELRRMDVGAVGLLGFYNSDRPFVGALAEQIPCVLFNKDLPGVSLPCAKPDAAEAARLAVDYFVRRGRRRIGMALTGTENSIFNAIAAHLEAELHRRGLAVDRSLWFWGNSQANPKPVCRWVADFVRAGNGPDGLLLHVGDAAHALERALAERGGQIGGEVDAVVCHSGQAAENRHPWAQLALNYADASKAATNMLLQIVEGKRKLHGAPVVLSRPELVEPSAHADS